MEKKLFRNEHDKMIAGVASGLADYMQVEVTIIRLLFALSTIFMAGGGLVAYIIMWIIVPVNNDPNAKFSKFNDYFNKNNPNAAPFGSSDTFTGPAGAGNTNWTQPVDDSTKRPFETQPDFSKFNKPNDSGRTIAGLLMLAIGCFFLMHQLDFIPEWFTIRNFFKFMWPMVFIALGISIIAKSRRKNEWANFQNQQAQEEQKKSADVSDAVIVEEKPDNDNNSTSTNPQA
ncbi:PspC domain-containing protein [Pedobacter endophyticus]|uniref:PspC domain-containing protein n=1 Tax=Pedobacter endophyticus TaxID=2789740 RepID=A0A7S9Q0Q8_9SPHI|nr:PspC domain-containing protein [Pedobacter endophyticus]QPH41225.1 PspC domain-containing protein [Pedobacter endophyticus]